MKTDFLQPEFYNRIDSFSCAACDYLYLMNRGYPERAAMQIVGDRYRLGKEERTVLFRGLFAASAADRRRAKLVSFPPGGADPEEVHIDGYNVLFTVMNYRLGKLLFIANDGYLRDAGGLHGRFQDSGLFQETAAQLILYIAELGFQSAFFYLDSPVSHSARHAELLQGLLPQSGLEGDCVLCGSADFCLKQTQPALAATADTVIIDALTGGVFDLARSFLEVRFDAVFPDLSMTKENESR